MMELYFKYRRVIARFRRGALDNEIDRIAASLSKAGYKRDLVKLHRSSWHSRGLIATAPIY